MQNVVSRWKRKNDLSQSKNVSEICTRHIAGGHSTQIWDYIYPFYWFNMEWSCVLYQSLKCRWMYGSLKLISVAVNQDYFICYFIVYCGVVEGTCKICRSAMLESRSASNVHDVRRIRRQVLLVFISFVICNLFDYEFSLFVVVVVVLVIVC